MKKLKIGGATVNQTPLDWSGNLKNILDAIAESKKLGIKIVNNSYLKQNLTVFYVINISFLKANTIKYCVFPNFQLLPMDVKIYFSAIGFLLKP